MHCAFSTPPAKGPVFEKALDGDNRLADLAALYDVPGDNVGISGRLCITPPHLFPNEAATVWTRLISWGWGGNSGDAERIQL